MLIWSDRAIMHITEFVKNAKEGTKEVARDYMNKLVDYASIIETMKFIGKKIDFIVSEYEIRQVIYKKHRLFYYIQNEDIVILAVLHSKLDVDKALKKFQNNT